MATLESYSYFSAGKASLLVQGPDSAHVPATHARHWLGRTPGLLGTGDALQSQVVFKDKG